jgi:hypothetical protein
MAETTSIRSSPAKSVDSRVLPSFYAGIVAELEPIYRDIDKFCLRFQDRLKLETDDTLKDDTLSHTVDIYVRREISNNSFVEILTVLSQLCRECGDIIDVRNNVFNRLSLHYKVYNAIAHRVPVIIRDALIKRCDSDDCRKGKDNNGADGVLIEGKYIITPYKICTKYGFLVRPTPEAHKAIKEDISNSGYCEDVKRYLLGELDVWMISEPSSE